MSTSTQNKLPLAVLPKIGDDEISDSNPQPCNLVTLLSAELGDSVDVARQSKGEVVIAHNAITATATSAEIDCRGFNAVSIECAVSAISSGNWLVEILGCAISGGAFGNCYELQAGTWEIMQTPTLDADGNYTFLVRGIPNYIKIRATRTTDGTLTCTATPMNV
ncbi:MAG: hypothetical protein AB1847_18405 [bacterium]